MRFFTEYDNKLIATFSLENFVEAWAFMTEVAMYAEKNNHHPRWTNCYNQVTIELQSHDAGYIVTQKDYDMAGAIEWIFAKYE